jgi:hypothetical protein
MGPPCDFCCGFEHLPCQAFHIISLIKSGDAGGRFLKLRKKQGAVPISWTILFLSSCFRGDLLAFFVARPLLNDISRAKII